MDQNSIEPVKPDRSSVEQSIFGNFAAGMTDALAAMLGIPPAVAWETLPGEPFDIGFLWRQPLTPLPGLLLIASGAAEIAQIGQRIMTGLGVENSDSEELASTFREVLTQTLGTVARSLTARLGREVAATAGQEAGAQPSKIGEASWGVIRITIGETLLSLNVGLTAELLDAIVTASLEPASPETTSQEAPPPEDRQVAVPNPPEVPPAVAAAEEKRRIELLADVELPVSISFGKAHIPLKDVLKFTNGSIIELRRAVSEPVDVVVNNCVIARGEVVVVEGNFGVRIQRVVSRRERLETLT